MHLLSIAPHHVKALRPANAFAVLWLSILFLALMPSAEAAGEDNVLEGIDQYLSESVSSLSAPGVAVALLHHGDVVYTRVWGVTGGSKTAVTTDTPFLIGSVSKPLTALAIGQLVDAGRIDLDAPISKYLEGFSVTTPSGDPARIKVRDLLGHTSGFSTGSGLRVADLGLRGPESLMRAVDLLNGEVLAAMPGERHIYSNANYLLLGAVIERQTGELFSDFMQTEVFDRLGMRHAAADHARAVQNGWQPGYRSWYGRSIANAPIFDDAGASYGYLTASISDLARFAAELMQPTAFPESFVRTLFQPLSSFGQDMGYGWGWRTGKLGGEDSFAWHAGANADFRAEVAMLPEYGWAIVVLTNRNNILEEERVSRMVIGVANLLRGQEAKPLPNSVPILRWVFGGLVGVLMILTITIGYWSARSTKPLRRTWFAWLCVATMLAAGLALIPTILTAHQVSWRTTHLFMPDIAASAVLASVLLILMAALTFRRILGPRKTD